jgi:SAM-dependent methyltransferase
MNETLQYYDGHAAEYAESTRGADMKYAYERFQFYLPKEGKILDLGCGSGRDALYFKNLGFEVDAADGSAEMVKQAAEWTGLPVRQMDFSELDARQEYQGIWACASLLHCRREELDAIIEKMLDALVWEGVFYASFKFGDFEGMRDGRWYTDMTIEKLAKLLLTKKNCLPLECWKSHDVRKDRYSEMWLNCIVRKAVTKKEENNAV